MSVVIVYGSGMFCDNQCQDDNDEGTGITCTYTKGKNGFKVVYHNGSFLLLQNIESIDISCVPGMEYIENDEELYDREPFTVEEEKLRKEAVQELLIYQG